MTRANGSASTVSASKLSTSPPSLSVSTLKSTSTLLLLRHSVEGVLGVSGGRRLRLRRPRTRVVMRVVRRKRSRVGAYKVPYHKLARLPSCWHVLDIAAITNTSLKACRSLDCRALYALSNFILPSANAIRKSKSRSIR